MLLSLRLFHLVLWFSIVFCGVAFYSITLNEQQNERQGEQTNNQPAQSPLNQSYRQKHSFSLEATMAFVDYLIEQVPKIQFSLQNKQLTITSSHQTEKQWLTTIEIIREVAKYHQLQLTIVSCSFSQLEKLLSSQCILIPKITI